MGLFDWLKTKSPTHGPTPEGLYGQLPKGASWPAAQADPAGHPEDFIPESDAYVFDIAEWRWDEQLWIDATTNSAAIWQASVLFSDYPMAEKRLPLRFGGTRELEARSKNVRNGPFPVAIPRNSWC
jgi:hypothetical protein